MNHNNQYDTSGLQEAAKNSTYSSHTNSHWKKIGWTMEEDDLLEDLFDKLGPHWKQISCFFPGRNDTFIKNRWLSRIGRLEKEEVIRRHQESFKNAQKIESYSPAPSLNETKASLVPIKSKNNGSMKAESDPVEIVFGKHEHEQYDIFSEASWDSVFDLSNIFV